MEVRTSALRLGSPWDIRDAAVGERTSDVDVTVGDLFDELQLAAELRFEAWRGPWGLMIDTSYARLGDSLESTLGDVDLTSRSFIGDALVGARVLRSETASLDFLAGGRIVWLDQDIDVGSASFGASKMIPKDLVGVQVPVQLSQDWGLLLRGQMDAPDLGWSVVGLVEFDVSRVAIRAGYRYDRINYDHDRLSLTVHAHGPYLGVGIRFGGEEKPHP